MQRSSFRQSYKRSGNQRGERERGGATLYLAISKRKCESDCEEYNPVFDDLENYPEFWDVCIDELDLSVRSYNCLRRARIITIGDVYHYGDLSDVRNLSRKSIIELREKINHYIINNRS